MEVLSWDLSSVFQRYRALSLPLFLEQLRSTFVRWGLGSPAHGHVPLGELQRWTNARFQWWAETPSGNLVPQLDALWREVQLHRCSAVHLCLLMEGSARGPSVEVLVKYGSWRSTVSFETLPAWKVWEMHTETPCVLPSVRSCSPPFPRWMIFVRGQLGEGLVRISPLQSFASQVKMKWLSLQPYLPCRVFANLPRRILAHVGPRGESVSLQDTVKLQASPGEVWLRRVLLFSLFSLEMLH